MSAKPLGGSFKIHLRAPPHMPFVTGNPGIPPNGTRPSASVRGTVEVRVGPTPVKAKWVHVEIRKHEMVPFGVGPRGGSMMVENVGKVQRLWRAPEGKEFDTLKSGDLPFVIPLHGELPPSVEMAGGGYIRYELIATVNYRTKGGVFKRDSETFAKEIEPIKIIKFNLMSAWPAYNTLEVRTTQTLRDDTMLEIERNCMAYGPGDVVRIGATIKSNAIEPFRLMGFDMALVEIMTIQPAANEKGKKDKKDKKKATAPAMPQNKRKTIAMVRAVVNQMVSHGNPRAASLELTIPEHPPQVKGDTNPDRRYMTIRGGHEFNVEYELVIEAACDERPGPGKILLPGIQCIIGPFSRGFAQQAVKDIGYVPDLCPPPTQQGPIGQQYTGQTPSLLSGDQVTMSSSSIYKGPIGDAANAPNNWHQSDDARAPIARPPSEPRKASYHNQQDNLLEGFDGSYRRPSPNPVPAGNRPLTDFVPGGAHSQYGLSPAPTMPNRGASTLFPVPQTIGPFPPSPNPSVYRQTTPTQPSLPHSTRPSMDLSRLSPQKNDGSYFDRNVDDPNRRLSDHTTNTSSPGSPAGGGTFGPWNTSLYQNMLETVTGGGSNGMPSPSPGIDSEPAPPGYSPARPPKPQALLNSLDSNSAPSSPPAGSSATMSTSLSPPPVVASSSQAPAYISAAEEKEQQRRRFEVAQAAVNATGSSASAAAAAASGPPPMAKAYMSAEEEKEQQRRRFEEAQSRVVSAGAAPSSTPSSSAGAVQATPPYMSAAEEKEQQRRRFEDAQSRVVSAGGTSSTAGAAQATPAYMSAAEEKEQQRRRFEEAQSRVVSGVGAGAGAFSQTGPPPPGPDARLSVMPNPARMSAMPSMPNPNRVSAAESNQSEAPYYDVYAFSSPEAPSQPLPNIAEGQVMGHSGPINARASAQPPVPAAGTSSNAGQSATPTAYLSAEEEKAEMRRRYEVAQERVEQTHQVRSEPPRAIHDEPIGYDALFGSSRPSGSMTGQNSGVGAGTAAARPSYDVPPASPPAAGPAAWKQPPPAPTSGQAYMSAEDEKARMRRVYEDAQQSVMRAATGGTALGDQGPDAAQRTLRTPDSVIGGSSLSTVKASPYGVGSGPDSSSQLPRAPSAPGSYMSAEEEKAAMRRRYESAQASVAQKAVDTSLSLQPMSAYPTVQGVGGQTNEFGALGMGAGVASATWAGSASAPAEATVRRQSQYPSAEEEKAEMRRRYEAAQNRVAAATGSPPLTSSTSTFPLVATDTGVSSASRLSKGSSVVLPYAAPVTQSAAVLPAYPSSSRSNFSEPQAGNSYPSAEQEKEMMRQRYEAAQGRVAQAAGSPLSSDSLGSGSVAQSGIYGGRQATNSPPNVSRSSTQFNSPPTSVRHNSPPSSAHQPNAPPPFGHSQAHSPTGSTHAQGASSPQSARSRPSSAAGALSAAQQRDEMNRRYAAAVQRVQSSQSPAPARSPTQSPVAGGSAGAAPYMSAEQEKDLMRRRYAEAQNSVAMAQGQAAAEDRLYDDVPSYPPTPDANRVASPRRFHSGSPSAGSPHAAGSPDGGLPSYTGSVSSRGGSPPYAAGPSTSPSGQRHLSAEEEKEQMWRRYEEATARVARASGSPSLSSPIVGEFGDMNSLGTMGEAVAGVNPAVVNGLRGPSNGVDARATWSASHSQNPFGLSGVPGANGTVGASTNPFRNRASFSDGNAPAGIVTQSPFPLFPTATGTSVANTSQPETSNYPLSPSGSVYGPSHTSSANTYPSTPLERAGFTAGGVSVDGIGGRVARRTLSIIPDGPPPPLMPRPPKEYLENYKR